MKKHHNLYFLGSFLKIIAIAIVVFFAFVIISDIADKAFERSTRFDCWKLEQYAATYQSFWITENENIACQSVGITVQAEVRK